VTNMANKTGKRSGGQSGDGLLMPIVGIAMLSGAGYLLYNLLSKPEGGNPCTNPNAESGDTACLNGLDMICQDGNWAEGGNACGGGGGTKKGMACSVPGSGYCGGSDNLYYVCKSDGYAYSDGNPATCPPQNQSPCQRLACSGNLTQCGGVVAGDHTGDYYTGYTCNAVTGKCNFMLVQHNSAACTQQIPGNFSVGVNGTVVTGGSEAPVIGVDPHHCNAIILFGQYIYGGNPDFDPVDITIGVVSTINNPLGGATVVLTQDRPDIGGFVTHRASSNPYTMDCNSAVDFTGSDGTVSFRYLRTFLHDNNQQTVNINIEISNGGETIGAVLPIIFAGGGCPDGPGGVNTGCITCNGITYGSVCE
jgi:hypothetical protein